MRTEAHQLQIIQAITSASQQNDTRTANEISTVFSTHPVLSSFWGLGVVDIHEKITHEKLHNNSLGVTKLVLRVIERYLKSAFPAVRGRTRTFTTITKELNKRLEELDK